MGSRGVKRQVKDWTEAMVLGLSEEQGSRARCRWEPSPEWDLSITLSKNSLGNTWVVLGVYI